MRRLFPRSRIFYSPKMPRTDWINTEREFRRYGYDPYNTLQCFDVWLCFNHRLD